MRAWPARLGPRMRTLLGVLFVVGATEAGLRIAVVVFVAAHPGSCGVRPELFARLLFAYSSGVVSADRPEQDGVVPDPRRGYRHVGGLRDRALHGSVMSTNSRGMRGTHEYAVPKPPSVVRIVAIGDSFTFGEGVTDDATWPAQLERALPSDGHAVEVANLGERAYAHDQMYIALQDEGVRLSPDAVILGFYSNDQWRDELTFYCAEKPRLSPGPEGWHFENVPVPPPWETRSRYQRLPLLYALPRAFAESRRLAPETNESGVERATEIIRRTGEVARSAGARFILVNIPDHPGDAHEWRKLFDALCLIPGTECVDPSALFRAVAGTDDLNAMRLRFQRPNDIHYSREGYAVVAEALGRHLTEHPLVPAPPAR